MSKRKRKLAAPPKFAVGDKVRVKLGVRDTDFPDMPLGGWAGEITELHDDGMYTVRWSQETLDNIHPVYRNRCERDRITTSTASTCLPGHPSLHGSYHVSAPHRHATPKPCPNAARNPKSSDQ